MLAHGVARPINGCMGYSPMIARTSHRLLTSALNTTHEHNSRINRTLRIRLACPSGCPEWPPLAQVVMHLAAHNQPRCHGPGAGMGKPRPAPFIAIACDESFTPTRSAQTPPVASSLQCVQEKHAPRIPMTVFTSPPSESAFAEFAIQGRLSRPSAKRSAIRRTRGAFHQRVFPREELISPSAAVASVRKARIDTFSIIVLPEP